MKHAINMSARIEAGSKRHTFGQKAHKKMHHVLETFTFKAHKMDGSCTIMANTNSLK